MKGTGVVQGFKSFLDKLHPSLPLTARESTHLLSTLKSSFRNHLDEVHPQTAGSADHLRGGKDSVDTRKLKPDQRHMRSSAAAAEFHLSSILTNPLLAVSQPKAQTGGVLTDSKLFPTRSTTNTQRDENYVSVKLALREGKPPIDVLEEYHQAGKATVAIATLCLHTFRDSILELPENARLETIRKVHPGKRTFQWLWSSGLHTSPACFANQQFNESLVHFILLEGHEQDLWDWLQLDVGPVDEYASTSKPVSDMAAMMLSKYRWKGRLLAVMAERKLQPPINQTGSADEAMSLCLKASAIKLSARKTPYVDKHIRYLPTTPSMNAVFQHYNRNPYQFQATDPELFDKFIITMAASSNHPINMMFVALLLTLHPTNPSGNPLLDQLKLVLAPNPSNPRLLQLHESIAAKPLVYLPGILRGVVRLEQHGSKEDAAWIVSKIPELFPRQAWYQNALTDQRRELDATVKKGVTKNVKDEPLVNKGSLPICT
nr:hypothetical protein CFP56_21909 [Quercus suber]